MDIIDKVSSVANEQKWRAQYFKQVDEMIDSPSETYLESVRYCLKWQVPFAGALHPKVAGFGDINIQDSYKDGQRGRIEVHEGEDVSAEPDDFGPHGAAGEFISGSGHESAREEHELRSAAG